MNSKAISSFFPFLGWGKMCNKKTLHADFMAGVTGAVIVLPQSIAFSAIAGVPVQYGLYTAVITPIIAALFGSSRHLVSGPTTAISIIVATAISRHAIPGSADYIAMVLTLTFLAGIFQFLFGILRLGSLVNLVSHSVITGFTAGSAVLVITSQLKNIIGVHLPGGENFYHTWIDLFHKIAQSNGYTMGLALCTLLLALVVKRYARSWPNLLIAMVVGSALAFIIPHAATSIDFVPATPAALPALSHPDFSFTIIKELLPEAFAVALIGMIEATSISRAIASKSNQSLDANQECIGQGLANITACFFSSYAASGSFTRSGVNYEAGAKTPMAAIFAAVILLLIILIAGPLTKYLPIAVMAGAIVLVGYNLIDFHEIKEILAFHKTERIVLLSTFLGTLFIDIEFAICFGVLLSLIFFLKRTSHPLIMPMVPVLHQNGSVHFAPGKHANTTPYPHLRVIKIDTPIFFGSASFIQQHIAAIVSKESTRQILIMLYGVESIDLSGAQALIKEHKRLKAMGGGLYFLDPDFPYHDSSGYLMLFENIGESHFSSSKYEILEIINLHRNKDQQHDAQGAVK